MKLRVYLDTSVFSAYADERAPDRQAETREFWVRLPEFEVATSEVTRLELGQTPDPVRRQALLDLLSGFPVHALTEEMQELADQYVACGIFTRKTRFDALHIAAAVFLRQNVLLSWNFHHMVNRRRRAGINLQNASRGLPPLEIVAPPEL